MAGLFRAPKPVVVPPLAPAPSPQPAAPPAQAAETPRGETRASTRQGTIATSARGVLTPLPVALTRKSLLGE